MRQYLAQAPAGRQANACTPCSLSSGMLRFGRTFVASSLQLLQHQVVLLAQTALPATPLPGYCHRKATLARSAAHASCMTAQKVGKPWPTAAHLAASSTVTSW